MSPANPPRPRRRWLVDGMNVVGSRPDGWWNNPDRAMRSLARALDRFAEATGDEVTVVFDKRANGLDPSHVEVVFARWKGRNAADHEIEVMVEEDPAPSEISVVTSDKRLVDRVTEAGARVMPAGRFRKRLETFEGNDGRG